MKKLQLLLVAIGLACSSFAQQVNDANAEIREAKNFHAIVLSSAFDVYLSQGNEEAVAVSASDDKIKEKIKVEVKQGVLYIGLDYKDSRGTGNQKLKAYISFRQLDRLVVSGACDVFVSGVIKSDKLAIELSGASDMKSKIEVDKLTVELSGASDIILSGKATQLDITASGASDFKGFDLLSDICNAHASGSSDIRITVNKELTAQASGSSDVYYKGEAVIREVKSSGSASVRKS
jgi:hypothetical protein